MSLVIYPLHVGTILSFEKSMATFRRGFGLKLDVPCLAWLIEGGGQKILVDTGPSDPKWALKHHWPLEKPRELEIQSALGRLNTSPSEIETVILSHLHWDHCHNLHLFPNALFVVQKSELEYALDPLPCDQRVYETNLEGIKPQWMTMRDRFKIVDGDQKIAAGVQVIYLPGHTPGSQGVLVDTGEEQWIIAADAVPLYENLEGDELWPIIPSGLYLDLQSHASSLRRLKLLDARILPGHDFGVLSSRRYPVSA